MSVLASQVGTKKAIVILINFTDVSQNASSTSAYYENLLFNTSAGANSMHNYYKEVSYNNINITGNIAGTRWFSASNNLSWYGADVTNIDENTTNPDPNDRYIFKLAKEAVIAADPYVNYADYDNNGDGVIDHLIIIHAGHGQEENSSITNNIWSHRGSISVWNGSTWNLGYTTADGVKAIGYTMQSEYSPLGVFAHEYGHDLGLPDLYDTDYTSNGVGIWDIMGSGTWLNSGNTPSHLSAWSKYLLGWVNPTKATASLLNEQINQSETNDDVYMLLDNPGDSPGNLDWASNGTGTGEYFLVENRRNISYDKYLPISGLLIWHIDESRGDNRNESHKLVDLEEADGLNHLDYNSTNGGNSGDEFDPFYNNTREFTNTFNPNSKLYNGSASNVSVTNISASGYTMTANLNVASSDWQYNRTLTITGTTAGAQTNYQMKLTVYNSSGTDTPGVVYLGGNARGDFGDIRFTKSDGVTLLDYWIESYTSGVSAVVWVEVDSIPASPNNASIYIYYGNPSATSASNIKTAFLIGDDFNDNQIDTSMWIKTQNILTLAETNQMINIYGTTTTQQPDNNIKTTQTVSKNVLVHAKVRKNSATDYFKSYIVIEKDSNNKLGWGMWRWIPTVQDPDALGHWFQIDSGTYQENALDTTDTDLNFHTYEIIYNRSDGSCKLYRDSSLISTKTVSGLANAAVYFRVYGTTRGANSDYNYATTIDVNYDEFFVRSYASPEPTWA